MGFMDKLRAELVDIVEWIHDSRHTLVWRFPRYHNQIKFGARLVVRPRITSYNVCYTKLLRSTMSTSSARSLSMKPMVPPPSAKPSEQEVA